MNVTKIVLSRCQNFHLKCIKFNFCWELTAFPRPHSWTWGKGREKGGERGLDEVRKEERKEKRGEKGEREKGESGRKRRRGRERGGENREGDEGRDGFPVRCLVSQTYWGLDTTFE